MHPNETRTIDPEYRDALSDSPDGLRGRGAGLNPGNRHEGSDPRRGVIRRLHVLGEHLDHQIASGETRRCVPTDVVADRTRTIINRVESPDLPFSWTVNPYRGCEHGCIYCYARPDHERLGWSCGLDFETKILAKREAPRLLRRELARPGWKPETIALSGVTDCYQPIERSERITRRCLEVFAECRQPVAIVTKSRLVLRDLELLRTLADHDAVRVAVSITTLDADLAARLEPRASSPADRLETIRRLADAGIPAMVMVAPVIPALTDRELPNILEAASDAGAIAAGTVLLRLPRQIKDLFEDWLRRHVPDRADRVLGVVRQTRGGDLYDAAWSRRMRGEGAVADQIRTMFDVFARRHGLHEPPPALSGAAFRRPDPVPGQRRLFD